MSQHGSNLLHMAPFPGRVTVTWHGRVIAESTRAIKLEESGHRPVYYVPRDDARMALFQRTTHRTHCPRKGDANYFTLRSGDGQIAENAVWTYETPIPQSAMIKDHLAFYTREMGANFALEVQTRDA